MGLCKFIVNRAFAGHAMPINRLLMYLDVACRLCSWYAVYSYCFSRWTCKVMAKSVCSDILQLTHIL